MSAFRTIYFRPRIALDWKIPVAALVRTQRGIQGVEADVLPDPRCLGSTASRGLLEEGLSELLIRAEWAALPISMGPHFELGREQPLPDVANPVKWVKQQALPRRGELDERAASKPQVRTVAWNHLRAWGVSPFVGKNLNTNVIPEMSLIPEGLPGITHFVEGHSDVLLMEPLILDRRTQDNRTTTSRIYERLSTYKLHWDRSQSNRECECMAYILPGSMPWDTLEDAKSKLNSIAKVFFTGEERSRREFTHRIQAVGSSLDLPRTMPMH